MWEKVATHPVVPLSIGVFLSLDTAGNVIIKSWVLLLLWLWIVVDLGLLIRKRRWQRQIKFCLFSLVAGFTATIMLEVIHFLFSLKLNERQVNTYLHLSANAYLPPSGDLGTSLFTVTNGGDSIIARYHLGCLVNLIVASNGMTVENSSSSVQGSREPLRPRGDATTERCLNASRINNSPECADVTLQFVYVLDAQPEITNTKLFRFRTFNDHGHLIWSRHPVGNSGSMTYLGDSPCEEFRKRMPSNSAHDR